MKWQRQLRDEGTTVARFNLLSALLENVGRTIIPV